MSSPIPSRPAYDRSGWRSGRLARLAALAALLAVVGGALAAIWLWPAPRFLTAFALTCAASGALGVLLERAEGAPGARRPSLAFAAGAAPFLGQVLLLDCVMHWPISRAVGAAPPRFNLLRAAAPEA